MFFYFFNTSLCPPCPATQQKLSKLQYAAVASSAGCACESATPLDGKENRRRIRSLPRLCACWRNKLFLTAPSKSPRDTSGTARNSCKARSHPAEKFSTAGTRHESP